jgi:hypothetical protein
VGFVAVDKAFDLGDRKIRLEFVVGNDQIGRKPANLAVQVLCRELDAVTKLLTRDGAGGN